MFLILCTTDALEWDGVGNYRGPFPSVRRIPEGRRPTVVYDDRGAAMKECERLALAHKGETFGVFTLGVAMTRGARESTLGTIAMPICEGDITWPL